MTVIFEQVLILIIFAMIGFALAKMKVVDANHTKNITGLLVYVFSTCNTFRTFATNFNVSFIMSNYSLIIASLIVLAVLLVVTYFIAKPMSQSKYEQYVYQYSLIMPNFGYMGYVLAEALFGEAGLIGIMVFSIPMLIYIYLISFCILTKKPVSVKGLVNALTVTMALGMVVGLAEIELPTVVTSVLDTSRACMGPVSMILAGIVISRFRFREILSNWKIYFVTALRLIVMPLTFGVCLGFFFPVYVVQSAVIFLSMPCGLNTVVFPDLVGEDCKIGAGLALVSSLLSCATIPIVFNILGIM